MLIEPLPNTHVDGDHARQVLQSAIDEYGLAGQLHVEVEIVEQLTPEQGAKFKRFVSKIKKHSHQPEA
jgi:hypothetical protein